MSQSSGGAAVVVAADSTPPQVKDYYGNPVQPGQRYVTGVTRVQGPKGNGAVEYLTYSTGETISGGSVGQASNPNENSQNPGQGTSQGYTKSQKQVNDAVDALGVGYASQTGNLQNSVIESGGISDRDLYAKTIIEEASQGYKLQGTKSVDESIAKEAGLVGLKYDPQTRMITDPLVEGITSQQKENSTHTGLPGGGFGDSSSVSNLFDPNAVATQQALNKAYLKEAALQRAADLVNNVPIDSLSNNSDTKLSNDQVASLVSAKQTNKEYSGGQNFLVGNIGTENSTGSTKALNIEQARNTDQKNPITPAQPLTVQKSDISSLSNQGLVNVGGTKVPASLLFVPTQEAVAKASATRDSLINQNNQSSILDNALGYVPSKISDAFNNIEFNQSIDDLITNVKQQTGGGNLYILQNLTNGTSLFPVHDSNLAGVPLSLGVNAVSPTSSKLIATIPTKDVNAKSELISVLSKNQGKDISLAFTPIESVNSAGLGVFADLSKPADDLVKPTVQENIKVGFGVNIPIPKDITTFTKNAFNTVKSDVLGLGAEIYSGFKSGLESNDPLVNIIKNEGSIVSSGLLGMGKLTEKFLPFTSGVIEPIISVVPKDYQNPPKLTDDAQTFLQNNTSSTELNSYMTNQPFTGEGYFENPQAGMAGSLAGDVLLNLVLAKATGGAMNSVGFYGIKLGAELGLPENVLRAGAALTNPIATLQDAGLLPRYEEVAYPILKAPAPSPAFPPVIENTWFYKGITLGQRGLIGFTKQGIETNIEKPYVESPGGIKFGVGPSGITRYNVARDEFSKLTLGTPVTTLTKQIIATGGEGTPLSEGSQFGSNMFLKNVLAGSYKLKEPTTYEIKINAANQLSSKLTPGIASQASVSSNAVILGIPESPSDLVFNNQLFGINTMKVGEAENSGIIGEGQFKTVYPNAPFNMDEMQVDRLLTLSDIAKSGKGVKPEVIRKLPDVIFKNLNAPQQEALLKVISKYQKPFAFGLKGIKSGDFSLGITKGSTSQINQVLDEYNRLAGDIEHLPLNSKALMHKFLQEATNALNENAEPNQLFENTLKPEFKTGEKRSLLERVIGTNKEGLKLKFSGKPEIKLKTGGVLVKPDLSESLLTKTETPEPAHTFSYVGGTREDVFQFAGGKDENGKYISTSGYVWGERTPEGFVIAKSEAGTKIKVSVLRKQELRKNAATSSLMSTRLFSGSRNISAEEASKISGIYGEAQGIFPIPHRAKDVGDTFGTSMSNADKLLKQGKENQAAQKAGITEHMKDVFPTYDFETMFSKKPGSLEYHMAKIKPDLSESMNIGRSKTELMLQKDYGIFRPSPPVFERPQRVQADYSFEPNAPESLLKLTKKPNYSPLPINFKPTSEQSNIKNGKENTSSKISSINPPKSHDEGISSLMSSINNKTPPPKPQTYNLKTPSFTNKTIAPTSYTSPIKLPSQSNKPYVPPTPPNPTPLNHPYTPPMIPPTKGTSLLSVTSTPQFSNITKGPPKGMILDLNTMPDQRVIRITKTRYNYIGNSTESTLVGLYNRNETIYGNTKINKLKHQDYTRTTKGFPKLVNTKTTGLITTKKTSIGRKETKKRGIPKF